MKKTLKICREALPVALMIALIPHITNDYYLLGAYGLIIVVSLALLKRQRRDGLIFVFGLVIMIVSEYFFISTGVETFARRTLFGLMPVWLPLLWAYSFVAIKRSVIILNEYHA
jgi:uncharacterized membrane protein YobD (UPF0266 family)